jgi:hypothetical protein
LTDINRSESENLIERDFIDRSTDQRDWLDIDIVLLSACK